MVKIQERVSAIDGFRCLAILSVVAYHYFYRFSPPLTDRNYYPYHYAPFGFGYGFYGVQLFFVISGFVIFQTLEKTNGLRNFILKRLIRLLPTLLLCAIITFAVVEYAGDDQDFPFFRPGSLLNFLPSLTFITPAFWNGLLHRQDIAYVDGVYWSLFAEIIFYIVGGIIFFLKPKDFLSNWLRITLLVIAVRIVTSPRNQYLFPDALNSVFDTIYNLYFSLNLNYWVYFALGVFFYSLYVKRQPSKLILLMAFSLVAFELYFLGDAVLRMLFLGIIALFCILIYKEHWLNFLKWRIIIQIGIVSYPLYLLHQNIGLILIHKTAAIMDDRLHYYLPWMITLLLVGVSEIIYHFYEKPILSFLRMRLTKGH